MRISSATAALSVVRMALGSFSDPASSERARFRYWLPDASVDPEIVKKDIQSAGSVGAGGVEFLPYFEYGGRLNSMPPGADWAKYNFGTEPFQELFRAALDAHDEHGLVMDFALGPNQGQGVPAAADNDGLQWDLVPHTAKVQQGGTFNGVIPGWGDGDVVAISSALVYDTAEKSFMARDELEMVNVTYTQYSLRHDSLTDHTEDLSRDDGRISLSFPAATEGSHYRIFTFFQKRSLHKNVEFSPVNSTVDPGSIFYNGSYEVDHFSADGARTVTSFWEEHLLTDDVKEKLIKVGNYARQAWEDSVEVTSNISWSRSMPERFQKKFGHSINAYLPLFTFQQNNLALQAASPGEFQCILDTEEERQRYLNNFHEVLGDGYAEYLGELRSWSSSTINKDLSLQPAYNLPLDMLRFIPLVDAPECESLGFLDNVDLYRRFSGAAQLAGRRVVSNELGAIQQAAYQYSIPSFLFSVNRGFVGGVNQYVLHGQAYTGNYYATTWPGHAAFNYIFSELWSEKQPSWHHGFKDAMDYVARVSHILRAGIPKVDVARYSKESVTEIAPGPEPADLVKHGWSYSYLSADNFETEAAYVEDGVLAPEGPAWKAILVESSQNMTINAVKKLKTWAEAGLPVILSGGKPGFYPFAKTTIEDYNRELSSLSNSRNVYQVADTEVAQQLDSNGVVPRVGVKTNGTWYTTWSEAGDTSYALVFSDLVDSTGEVLVPTSKKPYFYDAWTGERAPVLVYERRQDEMTAIPLELAGNQTVIIAFSDELQKEVPTPDRHVLPTPSNVLDVEYSPSAGLCLHVSRCDAIGTAHLSDDETVDLNTTSVPPSFGLANWTLVAEHWEAPDDLSDAQTVAVKRNTTHQLSKLGSWSQIPELKNVSGIGYYSTTFSWPPTTSVSDLGAQLDVGRVTHTLKIVVNGQQLPPVDHFKAKLDITDYLRSGEMNEVEVIVPTTMWNYLRTIFPQLKSGGLMPLPAYLKLPLLPMDAGLVGPVTVVPYKKMKI